ncbi:MAG: DNA primase [Patescibacteria group bacterium]
MSSDAERIKEIINIADVIGDYIELQPAGLRYKAKCPFHNEKTPSFIVSPDRGTYHCFGCGASGDVFSFVQEFEGVDFRGALKLLADKAGVEISVSKGGAFKEKKEKLFHATEETARLFEENMEKVPKAKKYMTERGVSEKTIREWRIGYALDEWRGLHDHLLQRDVSVQDMKDAGLIKEREGKTYDTFRDRVVFPIFDASGNIIAFSGRALNPTDRAPKYLNSPDTDIFNKSEVLYGLNKAGRSIRKRGYVIMVEGQFDLIMSHQAGMDNTVALSGTSVTEAHIQRLKRFTDNILLAFDSDDAGMRSAYRASALAMRQGMDVKIARLPKDKDPADCIRQSRLEWKKILTEAPHAVLHTLDYIKDSFPQERNQIKAIREVTFPLLVLVKSEMDRSYFLGAISESMGVPVENVKSDAEDYMKNNKDKDRTDGEFFDKSMNNRSLVNAHDKGLSKANRAIKLMAVVLNWLDRSSDPVYPLNDLKDQIRKADSEFAEGSLAYTVDPESDKEIMEAETRLESIDIPGIVSYSDELVYQYKTARLEERMNELQKKIKNRGDEEEENKQNLLEYQKCSRELHDIRAGRHRGEVRYVVE